MAWWWRRQAVQCRVWSRLRTGGGSRRACSGWTARDRSAGRARIVPQRPRGRRRPCERVRGRLGVPRLVDHQHHIPACEFPCHQAGDLSRAWSWSNRARGSRCCSRCGPGCRSTCARVQQFRVSTSSSSRATGSARRPRLTPSETACDRPQYSPEHLAPRLLRYRYFHGHRVLVRRHERS